MRILIWNWIFIFLLAACATTPTLTEEPVQPEFSPAVQDIFEQQRLKMVETTIEARDITDPHVLEAMLAFDASSKSGKRVELKTTCPQPEII